MIIGIDFGTSHTKFCCMEKDGNEDLLDAKVYNLLPSRIAANKGISTMYFYSEKRGELLGEAAVSLSATPLKNRIDLKQNIGKKVKVDEVYIDINDAIKKFMKHCLNIANKRMDTLFGQQTNQVCISYPANFSCSQRQEFIELVESIPFDDQSHFEVCGTIAEPVAAALEYLTKTENMNELFKNGKNANEKISVLAYDLGGGTFDLALFTLYRNDDDDEQFTYNYMVECSDGLLRTGGRDFTNLIYLMMVEQLIKQLGEEVQFKEEDYARYRNDAELMKLQLSDEESVTCSCLFESDYYDVEITRKDFEKKAMNMLQKTIQKTKDMVTRSKVQPDVFLLTGGACNMPMVKREIVKAFPQFKNRIYINKDNNMVVNGTVKYGVNEVNSDACMIVDDQLVKTKKAVQIDTRIPHDIGILYYDQVSQEKIVCSYIKEGSLIPCESEWIVSQKLMDSNKSEFTIYEANTPLPNYHKVDEDYHQIMKVQLTYDEVKKAGILNQVKMCVDRKGVLTIYYKNYNDDECQKASMQLTHLTYDERGQEDGNNAES